MFPNEFLNLEGESYLPLEIGLFGLHEYLEEFKGQEDALRYTLCKAHAPENKDTDFTWADFQAKKQQ